MLKIDLLKKAMTSEIFPEVNQVGKTKLASVMVIIYGSEPKVLMTEKPKHLNIHAGEITFPGGKWSEEDSDLLETAIRETREEIGLSLSRDKIIGQLNPVRTLNSGFAITPFVCFLNEIPQLQANPEVEKILHIPLMSFLQTLEEDKDPEHNFIQEMYILKFEDQIVWGASARVLKQVWGLLKKNEII